MRILDISWIVACLFNVGISAVIGDWYALGAWLVAILAILAGLVKDRRHVS